MTIRILLFLLLSISFSFPQNGNERLNKFLKDWVSYFGAPSISAGISNNGKTVWINSSGLSNLEQSVASTPQTPYRIASVSKAITGVAIMQLVEKGKLKLDEDIRKYLPQFPKKNWTFTIRQILNHTSGFRNYKNSAEFDSKVNFETTDDIVKYLSSDPLEYEPGTKYLYTTLSYNLLSAIIENVTGLYFEEYLKKFIFDPAGMKNTYLDYYNVIIPYRAAMYTRNKRRVLENAPLADHSIKLAGGGIISSLEDLLKFGNAILNNTLLKSATKDSMLKPLVLPNGDKRNYGLGFSFSDSTSKRFYFGHTGAWNSADLQIYPNEKVVIAHVMNYRDRYPENPSNYIASIFFRDTTESLKKPISDTYYNIVTRFGLDSLFSLHESIKSDSTINFSKREWMFLAGDLANNNYIQDAIITYTKILEMFPETTDVLLALGNAYLKDKNEGLALKNFRRVLQLEPNNQQATNQIKKLTGN